MHPLRRVSTSSLVAAALLVAAASPSPATDERVQRLSRAGAGRPLVGIDDQGTATAAWTERGQLYYALRPAGSEFGFKRAIPQASLVNESAMAVAANGNAVIAWAEGGRLRAVTRLGTRAFGPPQVLHGTTDAGNATFVDVAMSSSGRAVVAWAVAGQATPAIRAALSDTRGSFASSETLMTATGVTHPEAGVANDGAALVVWDSDTQSLDEIYGAAAPAGGSFDAPMVIETLGQGPGDPELDVNGAGAAILAYGDANEGCTGSCALFRLEARHGSVSGAFESPQNVTDTTGGHSATAHEVAIDDSGAAAILWSGTAPDGAHMFGRVAGSTGAFSGPPQVVGGPGRGEEDNFEISAGGGEFTAVWVSSGGPSAEDTVLRSHTQEGTFQTPHQISQTSTSDSADDAVGARNDDGDHIATWLLFTDDLHAWATPTNADVVRPALTRVTDSPDPYNPRRGRLTIRFTPSEEVEATVAIKNAAGKTVATPMKSKLIRGDIRTTVRWNGKVGGRPAKPGRYGYTISVIDAAGNRGSKRGSFTVE